MAAFKSYLELAKPERTLANVITAAAGFLLASPHGIHFARFAATLAGMSLVIASACVLNNYIDRRLDAKMKRTGDRVLVRGNLSLPTVIIYLSLLGVGGFLLLALLVNWLVVVLGLVAYFDYVVLYSWSKRRTSHSTLIGTISGSMSIVAGYCAVTGRLDGAALILFLIMLFWQMPHFYAIAIYRLKDYKAAGLPVWPAQKGIDSTKHWILIYMLAFLASAVLLTGFGYTHYVYLAVVLVIGWYWVWLAVDGFKTDENVKWARRLFVYSLHSMIPLMLAIALGARLP